MAKRVLGWAAAIAVAIGGSYARAARADSAPGGSPLADDRTLVALAVALACADAPEQGKPPETGQPPAAEPPATDGPELELVATVRAKALRFDVVPATKVVFRGATRKTTWKTERVNLPLHPQPGVTYRDVALKLTVTSDIEELASLLREARRAAGGIVMEQEAPAAGPASAPAGTAPQAAAAPAAPPAPALPAGAAARTSSADAH